MINLNGGKCCYVFSLQWPEFTRICEKNVFYWINFVSLCLHSTPDGRCHVSVPVHEALHSRGNVSAPSGLLPASPQQLLRLLLPVPPSRRLGRAWSQCFRHLLWGLRPDELSQLPCSPQVSWVWTNVLLTLLRQRMSCCVSTVGVIFIYLDFGVKLTDNLILSSLNRFPLQVSWLWPDSTLPTDNFLFTLFASMGSKT